MYKGYVYNPQEADVSRWRIIELFIVHQREISFLEFVTIFT